MDYSLNSPTWSYSQFNMFTQCRRMYFYDKYWSSIKDETKWELWREKYITSIPLLKGTCIHNALKKSIMDYKQMGNKHSLDDAVFLFRKNFREKYNESEKCVWQDPKKYGTKLQKTTILFEHYYKTENPLEKAIEAEKNGIIAIKTLWDNPIWKRIMMTPYEDFLTVDEDNFPNFNLVCKNLPEKDKEYSDIKVYSTIDLAIKYGDTVRIIDWKTGKKSESNMLQLAVYAMYAINTWKYDVNKIKFYLCYLGENTDIVEKEINVPTLISTKNIIINSYKEIIELFHNGSPAIEEFPRTKEEILCSNCRFRGVCLKAKSKEENLKFLDERNK